MALEFLQQGVGSLREEARRPLSIGANAAIGMFWLTGQLRTFGLSRNACPTRLLTSDDNRDLFSESNDLIVAYGNGTVSGWNTILLQEEELVPVAAPRLAAVLGNALTTISDIVPPDRPPLLNYPRSGPDWVDWRGWFNALSLDDIDGWQVELLSTYSQTIGEAIQGRGIALGSLTLLSSELEAGSLVRLTDDFLRTGRGYYLCHSKKSGLSGDAKNLADFLIAATSRDWTATS
jgi:DNA-binding transcriptional LysR family regulator